jgi:YfiH family protein
MMFKVEAHDLGLQCLFEDYLVFFGDQRAHSENLKASFPHFESRSVKQVHSDRVVRASHETIEADALFSTECFQALYIKTADCIPLFVIDPKKKAVLGIHAGWRGVVSQIASKAVIPLLEIGCNPLDLKIVMGPHIRLRSFEVHEPVWVQLMDSVPVSFHHEAKSFYEKLPNAKFRVDLEKIVRTQLWDLKIPNDNIQALDIDTVSDFQWHSYRRDGQQSGRNLSFVARFR